MAYNEENNTNGELIKVKAYYAYCLFPRLPAELGVGDNTFGITKWEVLEAIEGSPKEVGGYFDCDDNDNLESLKGCPKEVKGHFNCQNCIQLTNLSYRHTW